MLGILVFRHIQLGQLFIIWGFTFGVNCVIIKLNENYSHLPSTQPATTEDMFMANEVLKMLRAHTGNPGYHPLCALLDLAGHEQCTIGEQITIHRAVAKYVEAEQKAIEVSNKMPAGVEFVFHGETV